MIGAGYVGLVTAAGSPSSAPTCGASTSTPRGSPACRRARCRSTSRASASCWRRSPATGCTSRPTSRRRRARAPALRRRRTPPTYSGDADLSAVHAVVEAMPEPATSARARDEVDGARAAPARRSSAMLARAGQGRLSPTCPARSSSRRAPRSATSARPTAWSSATTATGRATRSSSSTRRSTRRSCAPTSPAPRWSSSPPTRSWRPRSPSSTRSPTSARRPAPTCPRSREGWGSTSASAASSSTPGIGFGGSCFPKDVSALKQLAGNSGYHFQLLDAGHRGQRAAEAPGGRQAPEAPRRRWSARTVALLGLAFKPDTDDMREASSLVLAARLQAEGAQVRAYDPVAERRGAPSCMPGVDFADSALDASTAPTPSCSSPSGPSSPSSTGRQWPSAMRGGSSSTGATCSTPRRVRAAGLTYEGIGRGRVAETAADAGADPRRRGGHAAAAAHLDRAQAGRAARRPPVHRLHARVAARPRRRRRRDVLRLPGRRACATCSGDGSALRHAPALRRGAASRSAPAARSSSPRSCSTSASSCSTATCSPTSTSARRSRSTRQTGARGTLALIAVEDPSAYGLVRLQRRRLGAASSSRSPARTRSTRT